MKKPATLAAIRPNAGIEAAFQKKIDRLLEEMDASIQYWLAAAYRAKPPALAQDAYTGSSATVLSQVMKRLARRWLKRFDAAAPVLADYFTTAIADRNDRDLKAALRKAGMSVQFKMTAEMNDVMRSTMAQQVGLIKSIAQEHLTQVEGIVMRSVQTGRDLSTMSKELQARFGVTKRRAALIARDQNNKASASMQRARQTELGITEAVWKHSHAGKVPRPSHVAADGQIYKIAEGMILDGERVWPGTAINCRCYCRPVLPRLTIEQRNQAMQSLRTESATA